MKKIIPIFTALLIGALCFNACKQEPRQHDTIYTFTAWDFSQIANVEQIAASADSIEVRKIIFKVMPANNNVEFGGVRLGQILEETLKPAFEAANKKGVGEGCLLNVTDANQKSIAECKELGFEIEYSEHGGCLRLE